MPNIHFDENSAERFLVLTVIADEAQLNRTTTCLEAVDIPVMVEHIEIHEGNLRAEGFRLMVPSHCLQTATRIVEAILESDRIKVGL